MPLFPKYPLQHLARYGFNHAPILLYLARYGLIKMGDKIQNLNGEDSVWEDRLEVKNVMFLVYFRGMFKKSKDYNIDEVLGLVEYLQR